MKWWLKALIMTAIWLGLTMAAVVGHNWILHGKSSPQQEQAIGEKYGAALANGLILIWILALLLRNKITDVGQTRQSHRFNTEANVSIAGGIMLGLIGGVGSQQRELVPVAASVGLVGWALIIWGTVNYARWKGYSGWFGLFGYLFLPGLAVLACLPNRRRRLFQDRRPEQLSQMEELSKQDHKPSNRFLLALTPLAAGGVTLLVLLLPHSVVPAQEWQEVVPPGLGFRVLMPGRPQVERKVQDTPVGSVEICKFGVKKKGTFLVCSVSVPGDTCLKLGGVEKLLEIARKDILSGVEAVHGHVESESHITLNGHPGLELEAHTREGPVIKARAYAATNQVYEISVYLGQYRLTSEDVPRFFDSFTLLDEPATTTKRGSN